MAKRISSSSLPTAAVKATRTKKVPVPALPPPPVRRFAALDFETADYGRDSACALSITVVEADQIVDTWTSLIRPPRRDFVFTYLHGIAWQHVKDKPVFGELWPRVAEILGSVDFIAAHNAAFDRSVIEACCALAAVESVPKPFVCTVKVARAIWGYRPTTLADVCRQLQIPLQHHDAASDARACAHILLTARQQGHEYHHFLKHHALKPRRK